MDTRGGWNAALTILFQASQEASGGSHFSWPMIWTTFFINVTPGPQPQMLERKQQTSNHSTESTRDYTVVTWENQNKLNLYPVKILVQFS